MTRKKSKVPIRENRVKEFREAREWTQEELARKTGLTKGFISKIEKGENFARDTADALCEAFSIPMESLYKENKKMSTELIKIKYIKDISLYKEYKSFDDIIDYDYLVMGKSFLDNACGNIDYNNIVVIRSVDNTMQPNICQGDFLFIDIKDLEIRKPGIYILRDDISGFIVKRIMFLNEGLDSRIRITMDNKIDLNFTETCGIIENYVKKICGRVIFYTRNVF
jgi:transcriptional regulator with XRE-family HTH domain